jgi:O-acetyl-ADP-ribose deacetylase (regulator of RNase III)
MSQKFTVRRGDIAQCDADAVVNAWNRNFIPHWLLIPQGVSKALRKAAGREPFRQVGRMGLLPLGGVAVTGAGELPAKYMLHAAALHAYWSASEESVRLAAENVFLRADELDVARVAIPLLGAGTGGVDAATSFRLIFEAWAKHPREYACELYVFDQPSWDAVHGWIGAEYGGREDLEIQG